MKSKGHAIVPSAPVFLADDKSTLFTSAGMQPMVPYLLGQPHPKGTRLADSQKCIRTDDIEEVGDSTHLTMFEMLGNWSLGDYFKDESIAWSWEFLTDKQWLGLDPQRFYVTVYEGDAQVPRDDESIKIWQKVFAEAGIEAKDRIQTRGAADNWWALGPTGPCGPDTEIFYYTGEERDPVFADTDEFIEVWNNVFMVYDRSGEGELTELPKRNVDTGMGLERIAAVIQGVESVFATDNFTTIRKRILDYANEVALDDAPRPFVETDEGTARSVRIIADHVRSAIFMAADGVVPSNTGRGYVMRRLVRRAIRRGLAVGIVRDLFVTVTPTIQELYSDVYPELADLDLILDVLDREEDQFRITLLRGVREFTKLYNNRGNSQLSGANIFMLFDTYGFPPELSIEDAKNLHWSTDRNWNEDFDRLMNEQKERSRTATVGEFKGGLADHEPDTLKHHTATHLMYQALREVLGDHVVQRGSNVNSERLRFDFSHDAKLTPGQKAEVERIVNEQIANDLDVWYEEHPTEEAFKLGAKGAFGDKYGDTVKVYFMGKKGEQPFSIEICGGPHVEHTGVLGRFKIQKEESSSAGVRRIKATVQ